ncbi:hypothetical protein [Microbacterium sp. 2RAF4]|uniref:hypothetical protein n=1 Tax=Microbacterium sp. 2RAF4 TaxID=3232999 RepID=UPI003F9AF69A
MSVREMQRNRYTRVAPIDLDQVRNAVDFFGQRGGRIKDPFGNIWWVVSHAQDVPEDVAWQRLQQPSTPSRCASRRRLSTPRAQRAHARAQQRSRALIGVRGKVGRQSTTRQTVLN